MYEIISEGNSTRNGARRSSGWKSTCQRQTFVRNVSVYGTRSSKKKGSRTFSMACHTASRLKSLKAHSSATTLMATPTTSTTARFISLSTPEARVSEGRRNYNGRAFRRLLLYPLRPRGRLNSHPALDAPRIAHDRRVLS